MLIWNTKIATTTVLMMTKVIFLHTANGDTMKPMVSPLNVTQEKITMLVSKNLLTHSAKMADPTTKTKLFLHFNVQFVNKHLYFRYHFYFGSRARMQF